MLKLGDLAQELGGTVQGDANLQIAGVRDLELIRVRDAGAMPQKGFIYFVESKKNFNAHPESKDCDALLTTKALAPHFKNAVVVEEPVARIAFIKLLELFENIPKPVAAEKGAAY